MRAGCRSLEGRLSWTSSNGSVGRTSKGSQSYARGVSSVPTGGHRGTPLPPSTPTLEPLSEIPDQVSPSRARTGASAVGFFRTPTFSSRSGPTSAVVRWLQILGGTSNHRVWIEVGLGVKLRDIPAGPCCMTAASKCQPRQHTSLGSQERNSSGPQSAARQHHHVQKLTVL